MNLDEFETQYRISLDLTLNQLQSVNLLIAKLQLTIDGVSENLDNLTSSFEQYIQQQAGR